MAWSRTCRPVPPVAANIVSLIRRSILDRCLPTGGLRVHAFAAGLAGETVSGHRAIVVEPEEGDHLANIGVVLDGAGRRPLRIGEDRVRNDSTLFSQLRPELLRKAEVSRPVAVQVADLPAAEFEPKLTKVTRHRMDARPGSDRCRDLISCRSCVRHELAPFGPNSVDSVIIPRYLARSPISMLSATKLSCTALACPPPSRPDARERETHDVARQLGHLLPAEGSLGKEAREERVTVPVEEALPLDTENARPHVVVRNPRADELAYDGLHASAGAAALLLDDDVEAGRGLGHLARHPLAQPGRMAL